MNPLPTHQNCNPRTICTLVEAHRQLEDLFSYYEDRHTPRYEEGPLYEYEGVRAEMYQQNEDPTFMIRFEEAVNGDGEENYESDYHELVETLQSWEGIQSTDTNDFESETEDGVLVSGGFTEFEVQHTSADWLVPTILAYGSLHLNSTIDDGTTYFCDRNDLEYFNIRNHFVVRGTNITDGDTDPERVRTRLLDTLNEEDHMGTSSSNTNLFIP